MTYTAASLAFLAVSTIAASAHARKANAQTDQLRAELSSKTAEYNDLARNYNEIIANLQAGNYRNVNDDEYCRIPPINLFETESDASSNDVISKIIEVSLTPSTASKDLADDRVKHYY
ncbi:uncharacterized protein L201_001378 [Kwoniella dendrophila CBS 6074]|uniref:Uncharacterized protein n=1 Tax=Kwoniella dendrophila CBS 6074 TaxID=1295534 RepID=A0AAX4JM51_9TREE